MWLGMRSEFRKQMVGYVLYWELIKDACERGYARFHLGRSTAQSGGEQFKKKWNAEAVQLYWQYILRTRTDLPRLNPDNRKYRLAIAAWRKLPVGVTQRIGPLIARSIP
jgi:lipid II:glycine glycyltransferase (peptidoglycan interpeptide bridge formation enzyme)